MATYVFNGYYGGNLIIAGGGNVLSVGSQFMLDPAWDVSSDVRSFTFTDDDGNIAGDTFNDEHGNDTNQMVTVRDALGNVIGSGQVYLEASASFSAPDGTIITLYTVEVNGVVMGEITTAPLQPGVTYHVSSTADVTSGPGYGAISSTSYDPDGANWIQGGIYTDSLSGGAGSDTIAAGDGADTIDGGGGDDVITYGTGGDLVHGGDGNDVIDDVAGVSGYVYNDTLYGDAGNDTIYAGAGNDFVDGGADNDVLFAEEGDDTLYGGSGADTAFGANGNDQIHGDDGDDLLLGEAGNDTLWGDAGRDTLIGGIGNDVMYGGADQDVFRFDAGWGNDTVFGDATGSDADQVNFSSITTGLTFVALGWEDGYVTDWTNYAHYDNVEEFVGGSGADTFNMGNDGSGIYIDGGAGADSVTGGTGADTIRGGAGNDTLIGNDGDDRFVFGDGWGSDQVAGGNGIDTIDFTEVTTGVTVTITGWKTGTATGGANSASFTDIEGIVGSAGADILDLQANATSLSAAGGEGADTILGGSGAETLLGGADDDLIRGGAGNDLIGTGSGSDTVIYTDGSGLDTISDFDLSLSDGLTLDQLDVSDLHDGEGNPVNVWDVTVSDDGAGNAVLTFPGGEAITLTGVAPAQVSTAPQLHAMGIPCFIGGTRIDTPQGPRPVEGLRPGDLVCTRDGPPLPLLWVGQRDVSAQQMQDDPRLCPIEIGAGALGNLRALRLSGQHAVFVPEGRGGALARARHLALSGWAGARVMRGRRGCRYYHLLLPHHALIRAEGAWTESFWPGPQAFSALDAAMRFALIRAMPDLMPGLLGVDFGRNPLWFRGAANFAALRN
ncbi:MAG: Hint domain-containing protein [Paracoccaceae bacterium]|nr:Hint domain-containing protein [Paracoccaceae bacterium]